MTATTSSSAATRFADLLEQAATAARGLAAPTTSAAASTAPRAADQAELAAALQTLFAAGTAGSGGLGTLTTSIGRSA
ncbi:hypothetical protein HR12_36730 [Microbacterium sp. SUBG005]|nr:hypothetical protein HR12_36730 [Microbacterium sp. SUBG005]